MPMPKKEAMRLAEKIVDSYNLDIGRPSRTEIAALTTDIAEAMIEASKVKVVKKERPTFAFPDDGECRERLGPDGRCRSCGWNINTQRYELP